MNPDCPPGSAVPAADRVPRQTRAQQPLLAFAGAAARAADPPGRAAQACATVDLAAIGHNVAVARSRTHSTIMAVVKADAFGHGAVAVARTALAEGAGWLGVATPAEALELRDAGIDAPIVIWLYGLGTDLSRVVAENVDVSVATPTQLDAVARATTEAGRRAAVHLKVDTGLSRNGCTLEGWPELIALARRLERAGLLEVRGLWTHLVDADAEEPAMVPAQLALLRSAAGLAERAGLRPAIVHAANSAAALHWPQTHLDMVRFGIGLYGVEPLASRPVGLRAAMTLEAPVVLTKCVGAGTGVSYHHDYRTAARTRLALIALGYADGIPRTASGRAQVWMAGRRHRVAGRIAMDQFVVDLGGSEPAGDTAVVFGPGERGEPTVTEWAAWAGTIPHEIMIGLGRRVLRRVIGAPARQPDNTGERALVH